MRSVAVIQARMGSSRLPGKVMLPLAGAPALTRMIERVGAARHVDAVLVATTTASGDDRVASLCGQLAVACVRGSEHDVLARYALAAESVAADADYLVRLTGDCPLIDPTLVDAAIVAAMDVRIDYVSNTDPASWPDGLDVEVVSRATLLRAHREAVLSSDREHVTPWIRRNAERQLTDCRPAPTNLSDRRWTLDEPEDYVLIAAVYSALHTSDRAFTTDEVLAYLDSRPEIAGINARFARNEGYRRSVQAERQGDT